MNVTSRFQRALSFLYKLFLVDAGIRNPIIEPQRNGRGSSYRFHNNELTAQRSEWPWSCVTCRETILFVFARARPERSRCWRCRKVDPKENRHGAARHP